jgi:hypothetical protein
VGAIGFSNFENLKGGTAVDTFDMTLGGDWLGLLDGGPGTDFLLAASGGAYTITGPNAGTLNGNAFKSIEIRA